MYTTRRRKDVGYLTWRKGNADNGDDGSEQAFTRRRESIDWKRIASAIDRDPV